mmetsp:Transcript_11205/g.14159  ORF Transcript_11205/g.14159 Transcript_11205/m.14159 type:complete len:90 (-) Transcript_11205:130-399(-)|eukprot:CAMPEP_0170458674 /NCGR_PEP_ID=MMETSP0123-20130129/5574_1 /TAXON_ID=182087 /ORGANISM="Favella ehrenbergii, Strain Fehren 1" /LENGTH=89 /DNA_ID=CAMNT_0010722919 /DNA_START=456 /DNA_END=725 /DNA_ORIENTATION=+
MLFWVNGKTRPSDKVFIMGDFNSEPVSVGYRNCIEAGYKSTYKEVHGSEPSPGTWPTGLQAEFMDAGDPMILDYIFYRGPETLRPVSAE